jgi:hypothetical protein
METPAPVDINKLKSILGNAKKVMAATEQKFPSKTPKQTMAESYDYNSGPMYSESDEREPQYPTYVPQQQEQGAINENIHKPMTYDEQAVMNSRLPANIKEAMLKNPIPKLSGPPSKFSLEGLEDLIEKPKFKSPAVPLRESSGSYQAPSNMITVSLDQLNEMIDQRVEKRINEVLANMYTKTITEQAIKKTISTLITEGKIVKKK